MRTKKETQTKTLSLDKLRESLSSFRFPRGPLAPIEEAKCLVIEATTNHKLRGNMGAFSLVIKELERSILEWTEILPVQLLNFSNWNRENLDDNTEENPQKKPRIYLRVLFGGPRKKTHPLSLEWSPRPKPFRIDGTNRGRTGKQLKKEFIQRTDFVQFLEQGYASGMPIQSLVLLRSVESLILNQTADARWAPIVEKIYKAIQSHFDQIEGFLRHYFSIEWDGELFLEKERMPWKLVILDPDSALYKKRGIITVKYTDSHQPSKERKSIRNPKAT